MTLLDYSLRMWELATQGDVRGVWFFAALYCFLIVGYSFIFQVRTRSWPSVRGELLNLDTGRFGPRPYNLSDQQYVTRSAYRYRVNDTDYEGHRLSPWVIVASHNARFVLRRQRSSVQPTADGTVPVYYNPKKPQKSYLMLPGPVGMLVTLVIALVPIAAYIFRYHL